jgi:diguanylate cyclase (GGDEF)-like protein
MGRGLTIQSQHRHRRALWLRWVRSRLLVGHRRRHRLHQQVHRLRRQVRELRHDNAVLTERNLSIEQLSAELMRFNLDLSQVNRLDPMTGLLNRAAFEANLAQEHALSATALKAGRTRPYSVIMIDVDHFKFYNDSAGHPAGDRCLVAVAEAIRHTVRSSDAVGRYGGEEIIVLCPGLDTADAEQLAQRVHQAVRDLAIEHPHDSAGPIVTVSVGLATGGLDDSTPNGASVVLAADRMLYHAKGEGRDRVVAA